MNEPLENLYFNWLYAKVASVPNPTPSLTFEVLLRTLHNTEFAWLLPGDDNRAEDGKELRREFLVLADIPDNVEWRTQIPCSVLEMLIAFAKRAEMQTETSAREWFWVMLRNLSLDGVNDASGVEPEEIQEVVHHFLWREYRRDGDGGLFPLNVPKRDQTELEIWYQFCDYLADHQLL